jgi:GNAT superfamily N-acetyltransferase
MAQRFLGTMPHCRKASIKPSDQVGDVFEDILADSGVMFVCEIDNELISAVLGNRGIARRTQHALYVIIGVLQAWVERGVGRALLEALEGWARSIPQAPADL